MAEWWPPGTPVRWENRDRWWYGVVLMQEGEDVVVVDTAKGEERPAGKVGRIRAEQLERDADPVLVECDDCGSMRSSIIEECFCREKAWTLAPRAKWSA